MKRISEQRNKLSKVAGFKINTQKSVAFLCTNNEQSKKEIKKKNSIHNSLKQYKILRNKHNQGYENKKLLLEEIKEDTNKWKGTSCSWIGRINIV